MNENNFSWNEKYVRKIIFQFAAVLAILILTGFFMRAQVSDLLNATVEKMLAKQASDLSVVAEERFNREIAELKMVAKYLEAHPNAEVEKNFLAQLKADNENITVGLLKLDGSAIHGETLSKWEFMRFPMAYRGNDVVDYCADKGLLFAVPVMHGGNVKAVIYRLYDETILTDLFGLAEYNYNSDLCVLIQERNGQVIIPYKNYGEAEKKFFMNEEIKQGFKILRDKLENRKSAAVYSESSIGKFFLFATDLPQTNCSMIGYIPWAVVAGDIFRIYTLLISVATLILIFMALVSGYLFVVRTKVAEGDALREAKKAADDANNAKSVFLANMSHEIRTPINAIIGMNEMILRESQNPDVISYAQNSAAAGETLLSLINDILDFSKIESGKFKIIEENYKLSDIIKNLAGMMRPRAEKKNLSFDVKVNPATENILYGDSVRIRQIAINLLSNAVKYTKSGSVEFIVDSENVSNDVINLLFTVKDTGIGISAEDLSKLFGDFERFNPHETQNIEGTGLGLAITNKLVKMMNGKIEVHSVYGEGSTFTAVIPQKVVGNELIGTFTENTSSEQEKYCPSFIAPDAEILIVDDNEMNLLVATNLLKATQIKIDTALSGEICLQKLSKRCYDLIFLDQMMPNMDGVQTLKAALAMENNLSKGAPMIALTADAISGTRERLLDAGFKDYLTKPIDAKLMEEILIDFLPAKKVLPTPDSTPTPEKNLETVNDLIDVEKGLEYSAGMTDFYKEILLKFADLKDDKQKKLQTAYEAGDWKNYTVYVHALKSTSLSIGSEKISEAAKNLETAGKNITAENTSEVEKQENIDFIKKNHAATMKLYDTLAEEAKKLAETL